MLFNSKVFIFFFLPIALAGFFVLARMAGMRAARLWLLAVSLVFYGWWSLSYLALLIGWILVNFALGRRIIAQRRDSQAARFWLAGAVALNLALLGYFKYAAFIVDGVASLTGLDFAIGAIVLPLAVSFHTFQQIAYLVDVRRGNAPRYSLVDYLLFVSFFPQLIAGPIVHHHELTPQLQDPNTYRFNSVAFSEGLAFFVIGLVKKLCLADPMTAISSPMFAAADITSPPLFHAWMGTLAFSLGLYFDFSGYSDMAVGLARMFGITLPYNFDSPYKAHSIIEFWRRWHMTLSRWLRDYLYIPLGGARKGPLRRVLNLFLTMLLGGLWHGAAWTFVAWGAVHGAYLIVNHGWNTLTASRPALRLRAPVSRVITLLAVMVAWVFFAAPGFQAALSVFAGLLGLNGVLGPVDTPVEMTMTAGLLATEAHYGVLEATLSHIPYALVAAGLAVVLFAPNTQQIIDGRSSDLAQSPSFGRLRFTYGIASVVAASAALFFCLTLMSDVREFVYFQF